MNFYSQLIYMSLIATIVGCFILIFRKMMKNRISPRCRYNIWVIFIVFLIFFAINCTEINKKENDFEGYIEQISEYNFYNEIEKMFLIDFKENKIYLFIILVNLLFKVSIFTTTVSISLYIIINFLFYNEPLEDERIHQIVNKSKEKLGIQRKIKLIYQSFEKSPSIIGVFDVKILFSDLAFFLNDRELECIIMHELSHYKRRDNIMSFIIKYLKILYLFNPIIGKLLDCIRTDIEVATDRLAISKIENIDREEYCNVLIKMKKMCNHKSEYGLGLVNKNSDLSYRINAIIDGENLKQYNTMMIVFASIVIFIMVFVLSSISYGKSEIPNLYLKLEDGTILDMEKEENIRLSSGTSVSLVANNDRNIESIFYEKNNINGEEYYFRCVKLDRKIYYETGEYVCKITANCKNGESVSYRLRIFVE